MAKSQNLSTGPTSEEGKAISCQNSTKHGLTSVKLNTAEEQIFYETMVELFTEEHTPQGLTEKILVSDLAMIRIRLNRFDKAENALFFIEQDKQATHEKLLYAMGIDDRRLQNEIIKKLNNGSSYIDEQDPNQKELDRLYRYKTTLDRQYSAKLSQLIQLQEIKRNKHKAKVVNK
jgi:hypothetical protein